jgi:DNA-binding transcriptional ArsR family regulator
MKMENRKVNINIEGSTLFNHLEVKKAAIIVRSLNHKLRQQIIVLLETNEKMIVTDIFIKLRIEQSVASQHLAILRRAGFVKTSRDGKNIYYSIDSKKLLEVSGMIRNFIKL